MILKRKNIFKTYFGKIFYFLKFEPIEIEEIYWPMGDTWRNNSIGGLPIKMKSHLWLIYDWYLFYDFLKYFLNRFLKLFSEKNYTANKQKKLENSNEISLSYPFGNQILIKNESSLGLSTENVNLEPVFRMWVTLCDQILGINCFSDPHYKIWIKFRFHHLTVKISNYHFFVLMHFSLLIFWKCI